MDEQESFEGLKQRNSELESEVDEIKARNERLEKILSSLDTGLSIINSDFTISWVNQKIRDMFPDGEPIGRICHRFYESSDEPCEPCPTLQCFKSGRVKSIERYNPTRESWFSIISQPVKDSDGRVVHVLEGVTDITERKRAEDALLESLTRYNELVTRVPVGVYIFWIRANGHMEFEYVSDRWCEIHQIKRENVLSDVTRVNNQVHPDDRNDFLARNQESFRNRVPFFWEGRFFIGDGKLRWLRIESTPVVFENGDVRWFGVTLDITERKQAEAENKKLQMHLSQLQKAESLGRMAGSIAHHFNNQLSVVMGNLELVLDDLPDDAENRELLFQSFEAGHKATEVSQQMLRYLGHISGNQTTVNLSDVCHQSLTLLHSALRSGVTLNVDFPDSGPFVHADAGQIQQVLTNLFTNAQESFPDNQGIIGLIIQTVSHEDISTSNRFPLDWQPQDIPYACLEISDTGCGISKEEIEKLFDPFYTTKFTGRGMGLPVTMGILKTQNGCITVDSEPESGTVFQVYLPVSTAKKSVKHEKETNQEGKVGNGGAVLLIEDEESVRNMAKAMLTRLGYAVIEAQDGVEAVSLFQKHQNDVDCVLSDLTMPRMNGWETLTALREKGADVPVILASGYDKDTVMAGDHPELPQGFLNKPYSKAALKDVLMEVIKLYDTEKRGA